MKLTQSNGQQTASIGITGGFIGGALLITASILSTKGYWVIAVYALVMLSVFLFLRSTRNPNITFKRGLIVGVSTFTIMSYILYFYIIVFVNTGLHINISGHAVRFLLILSGGTAVSAILGLLLVRRKKDSPQFLKAGDN